MNWLVSDGQTGPVFPYDNPSKQKLYNLATSDTPKGNAFIDYMVNVINIGLRDTTFRVSRSDTDDIFANLFLEEFYLFEGEYSNSGYNPKKERMFPGVGHAWNGFGWVYRKGTFSLRLIKGDCANILKTQVLRKQISFSPSPSPTSLPSGLSGLNSGLGKPTLPQAAGQKVNSSLQNFGVSSNKKEEKQRSKLGIWIKDHKRFIYSVSGGLVFTGVGFIAHDKEHQWYAWFPKTQTTILEKRGEPDGIP